MGIRSDWTLPSEADETQLDATVGIGIGSLSDVSAARRADSGVRSAVLLTAPVPSELASDHELTHAGGTLIAAATPAIRSSVKDGLGIDAPVVPRPAARRPTDRRGRWT